MVKEMKKIALLFTFLFAISFVNAQDVEITDKDLQTYYIIDLAKNSVVKTISPMVSGMIEKQNAQITVPEDKITNDRWKKLQATKGDAAKLSAMEAKEWEIKFLEVVTKQIDKKKKAAGDVVKLLAGNALGGAKYKAIRAGLKDDADMKSKYDAIKAGCAL